MNNFKTLIAEALAAGTDINAIMSNIAAAANEAEREYHDLKQKEYEKDLELRPWAYGLACMEDYAEKILDGTLTKQDAMELYAAIALKDYPPELTQSLTRSDLIKFTNSIDHAFKTALRFAKITNDGSMSDNDKIKHMIDEMFNFDRPARPSKQAVFYSPDEKKIRDFIASL